VGLGVIEKGRKSQRTMMEQKEEEGLPFSHPPLGYVKHWVYSEGKVLKKTWSVDRKNSHIIKKVFEMYVYEERFPKEICVLLNIPICKVYRFLNEKKYAGIFYYVKKEKSKGADGKVNIQKDYKEYKMKDVTPIISLELFEKAQKKLGENRIKHPSQFR